MLPKRDSEWFNDPSSSASGYLRVYNEFIYRIYEDKVSEWPDISRYEGLDELLSWCIYNSPFTAFTFSRVFYTLISRLVEENHIPINEMVSVPKYRLIPDYYRWEVFIEDDFSGFLQSDEDHHLGRMASLFVINLLKAPLPVYNRVLWSLFNIILNCPNPEKFKFYSETSRTNFQRTSTYSQNIHQYFLTHNISIKKGRKHNHCYLSLEEVPDFQHILSDIIKITL